MAGDSDFTSNLGDYDKDGQYPSAASPLDINELLKARAVNAPVNPAAWPAMQDSATARPTGASSPLNPAELGSTKSPDYSGLAMSDLQRGDADLTAAETAAQAPPPDSSQLDALDKNISAASVPTQLRANRPDGDMGTGTGEMLAQYKPSVGSRIWRGVKGGLEGLALGGPFGALYGALEPQRTPGGEAYGAPNSKYEQAEGDRQATLANLQAQRPEMSDALKNAIAARKQQVDDLTKLGGDRTSAADATTKVQTAQNETPEAKAAAAQKEQEAKDTTAFNDRQLRWKTVGALVPPSQRDAAQAHYLLTGQLPTEREPRQPSAEELMLGQGISLWHKANPGKPLGYQDYMQILSDIKGKGAGANDEDVDAIVSDATGKKQQFADGYTRIEPGTPGAGSKNERAGWYLKNGSTAAVAKGDELLSPQAFSDRIDQFRKDANVKLGRMGAQIDEQGQLQQRAASGAAQPAAPAQAATSPNENLGSETRYLNGKPYRQNKKTNKWVLVPGS